MSRLAAGIADDALGDLQTDRPAFYERLGRELWNWLLAGVTSSTNSRGLDGQTTPTATARLHERLRAAAVSPRHATGDPPARIGRADCAARRSSRTNVSSETSGSTTVKWGCSNVARSAKPSPRPVRRWRDADVGSGPTGAGPASREHGHTDRQFDGDAVDAVQVEGASCSLGEIRQRHHARPALRRRNAAALTRF